MHSTNHQTTVPPLAVSKRGAANLTSLSESVIEQAIRANLLQTRRYGNRTLIRMVDLKAWVDSMPIGQPASPPQFEGRRTGRPRTRPVGDE